MIPTFALVSTNFTQAVIETTAVVQVDDYLGTVVGNTFANTSNSVAGIVSQTQGNTAPDTQNTFVPESVPETQGTVIPESVPERRDTTVPESVPETQEPVIPESVPETRDTTVPDTQVEDASVDIADALLEIQVLPFLIKLIK